MKKLHLILASIVTVLALPGCSKHLSCNKNKPAAPVAVPTRTEPVTAPVKPATSEDLSGTPMEKHAA